MGWLTDPLADPDFQRMLGASLLAVLTTSLVGTWVVVRGMSFIGDAIAHGVLPGIAIALLLDTSPLVGAAVAAALMIGGIHVVGERTSLAEDTAIGLLFVGMLALGVMLISLREGWEEHLTEVLFGETLEAVTVTLGPQLVVTIAVLVVLGLMHRPFTALAFSADKADVLGMRPGATRFVLLAMVATAVVSSFQAVGTLLVFAFLVAPPATAALVTRRVVAMMLWAVGFGVVADVVGLVVSHHAGTPPASTVAVVAVVQFFVVLTWLEVRTARERRAVHARAKPDRDGQPQSGQAPTSSRRWSSST